MMMTTTTTAARSRLMSLMLACAVACAAFGLAHPQQAAAQDKIEVSVRTIHALKEGKAMDTKLDDLKETLTKAFEGYTTFKDLGTQSQTLTLEGSGKFSLPEGTDLEVTYKGTSKDLLRLGLAVGKKFKSDVRVSPGGTFFQAGLPHEGGILIIAITIR